jgi:hypothetical protein
MWHGPKRTHVKAKHREEERLFKIAQAQSLFVVKIAHFGSLFVVSHAEQHRACFEITTSSTPSRLGRSNSRGWPERLGRQDSNLGMAESKSTYSAFDFKKIARSIRSLSPALAVR